MTVPLAHGEGEKGRRRGFFSGIPAHVCPSTVPLGHPPSPLPHVTPPHWVGLLGVVLISKIASRPVPALAHLY